MASPSFRPSSPCRVPVRPATVSGPAATQTPPSAPATVGLGVTTLTGAPWAVAGVRFGRLSSGLLRSLAELLQRTGTPWLAITPWRSLAIRCTGDTVASDMLGELVAIGFLPPHHPAAAVVVCVGASGCWQTELDTLAMAERVLAEAHDLGRGYWVHVSGCDKFCATRAAAPVTLVGRCDSSGFDTRRLDHAGREA